MRSGYIVIDKPAGITSADVVHRVKRSLDRAKVGHAGTLDPGATGILVCLVNGATRLADRVGDGIKEYTGTIRLGVVTSSDDAQGSVLRQSSDIPSFDAVISASKDFIGEIEQVPPRVSAVQVGGKRAYAMERRGEEFELKARKVLVEEFHLEDLGEGIVRYSVVCGPGTYIRSLARDLGERLGCGASIADLRRTRSGGFSERDAVQLDAVTWDALRDWSELLPGVPRVNVSDDMGRGLLGGREATIAAFQRIAPDAPFVIFATIDGLESLGIVRKNGSVFQYYLNIAPQDYFDRVSAACSPPAGS